MWYDDCIMEQLILMLAALITIAIIGYIVNILVTSSGSELKGNSLDDFIVAKKEGTTAGQVAVTKHHYHDKFSDEVGVQMRIIYGTEYGASEDIAKMIYKRVISDENLCCKSIQPRLINSRDYEQIEWKNEQLIVFVISTSGDGVPPTDARQMVEFFCTTKTGLTHLQYSVLALGDSNYPQFCRTGVILDSQLESHGAVRFVERQNVDMENSESIEYWINSVLTAIPYMEFSLQRDYLTCGDGKQLNAFHRNNPFYTTIKAKRLLTKLSEPGDRETVHIEFDLRGSLLSWVSGDALGIYPENEPSEVVDLLNITKLSGEELVSVENSRYTDSLMTLRMALTKYCNLKDPQLTLINYLKKQDPDIKFTCQEDTLGEVRDVLECCTQLQLTAQQLVDLLKPLQPRYYSISSSPVIDNDTACVTVAAVRYKALGKDRTGVCSVHLTDRCAIGSKLGVFISHNPDFRLPDDGNTDILLIGPGTGIAPFMSFIAERVFRHARGRIILFFGCRNSSKDFLYQDQLVQWEKEGHIELHCAFSRENPNKKVYVQHLMRQQSNDIHHLIQNGGNIYICGDASRMAHDVHSTLIDICMEHGMTHEQAVECLTAMTSLGKYQKDVWV